MKQLSLTRLVAAACILAAGSTGAMATQTKHSNDPSRWYQGDSTQQQRLGVLKKEINAAYAEQTAACKRQSSSKRASCMKQARLTYEHDNAHARQLVANAPQSEITERVVSVTPAPDNGMQTGSSAYGSSGAGATGSGSGATGSMGQSQSGQSLSGAQQSGVTGASSLQQGPQSGAQSGMQSGYQSSSQMGVRSNSSSYGNSGNGATSTSQGDNAVNGAQQSGSQNSNGSQSDMNSSGSSQSPSMGAGTGATQSDTQGQSGSTPPVQR